MPDHDSLSLAAALLASGAKPPRVVETLAELYAVHAQDPVPHYVLSPQLARFFADLEKRYAEDPVRQEALRRVALDVVAEVRRGEPGPIRVEYVNDWRDDRREPKGDPDV